MRMPTHDELVRVYGASADEAAGRFEALAQGYAQTFGADAPVPMYFSSPGRSEIIGNHTDHNGGRILAASITMDTICAAAPTDDGIVTIVSEGYAEPTRVDTANLSQTPHCQGTPSLVAGMIEAAQRRGYTVGGFNACVSSEVIPSAGVSSSASFEMLVCEVINHLFCGDAIAHEDYARIGQYAENVWWNKASGLMDQMACAVGGTILLDFSNGVRVEPVDFGFDQLGYDLVITNTGKGHADLSAEYSSVPDEMHAVAAALGKTNLCQTDESTLLADLPRLRETCGDRPGLRALHYFEECRRVDEAVAAIRSAEPERVLGIITASGNSSWKWLQNAAVTGSVAEQPIPMALALTELFLSRIDDGACRLHGGGFAGVIMCVVPKASTEAYVDYLSDYVGRSNVYPTNIRATGVTRLDA